MASADRLARRPPAGGWRTWPTALLGHTGAAALGDPPAVQTTGRQTPAGLGSSTPGVSAGPGSRKQAHQHAHTQASAELTTNSDPDVCVWTEGRVVSFNHVVPPRNMSEHRWQPQARMLQTAEKPELQRSTPRILLMGGPGAQVRGRARGQRGHEETWRHGLGCLLVLGGPGEFPQRELGA